MNPEHLPLLLVREMPYGKYQGRKIADLPGHYLGWFAREGFPRGELGELLALMYELDHNDLRGLLDPLRQRGRRCHLATSYIDEAVMCGRIGIIEHSIKK